MEGNRLLWSNAVISAGAMGCVIRSWTMAHPSPGADAPEAGFLLGIGAATWLAYGWQRHVKSTREDGLRPAHRAWQRRHHGPLRLLAFALLPLAAWPFVHSLQACPEPLSALPLFSISLGLAALLTLLYAGLPGDRGIRFALRRWPRMKLLWIGLVWAFVTAGWPALVAACPASVSPGTFGLLMLERGCTIMALTLPFDLRDRHWDPPELRTWPQRWGPRGTRFLAMALLLLSAAATWRLAGAEPAFLIGTALMAPAVLCAEEGRKAWYYLLLDGLLVLDAAVVLALV